MFEKKQNNHHEPDMSELKAVVIDRKSSIYEPLDADPNPLNFEKGEQSIERLCLCG